jgi:uncharacterized protein YaiE (UPF0345 family)
MDRTTGADAAQALMASAPALEPVADPASHAVLSIKAVTGDFDFVDGDGDHNRLTMMNGALQWMRQNQGGWQTLSSGALTLQAATGALVCGDTRSCMPLAEVQKLLLVAQTETLSHVTIHGVTGEVEFGDTDGDRNRLAMMDGKLQWQTANGATGWQVLSEGPIVLDQITGSLKVAKATARMMPEDLNRLLQAARFVPVHSSQKLPLAPGQPTQHPPMQAPVMMDMGLAVQNSNGPVQGVCPACKHQVVTIVTHEFGTGTAVTSCCLCCFCAIAGGFIPCCLSDCQDAHHQCPNCKKEVGVKTFLF